MPACLPFSLPATYADESNNFSFLFSSFIFFLPFFFLPFHLSACLPPCLPA
jgi:VIT1/CCC1 family predicted Fe2+/Mn2+ transporter